MATTQAQYQVRALERALQILNIFSLDQSELSLSEIAVQVDLAPSTALRLLSMLVKHGYVEKQPDTDRYRVGVRAFELGSIYLQTTTIEARAQPFLRTLAGDCNQTANLAILDRGQIVHIAVVPPSRPIRYYATVGERESAHSTGLGKALLAGLSDDELREVIAQDGLSSRTDRTITTLSALRSYLAKVREQGFALDNQESFVGLRCVAAPIHDDKNRIIAAISISGPASEFDDQNLPGYIDAVKRTARKISGRLGNNIHLRASA